MKNKATKQPDVEFHNAGSIIQIEPISKEAKDWIDENVNHEGWQWMGARLCVEPRYAVDIATGMAADGLLIE